MSRSTRALSPARRDAGLRRLRVVNRVLIGAAVVSTGLLADVAANAFPGHKRAVKAATEAGSTASAVPRHRGHAHHRRTRERRHEHAARHRLSPPAAAPAPASATAPAITPAPAATAAPATTAAPAPAPAPAPATTAAPAPAPAPVVSGGS